MNCKICNINFIDNKLFLKHIHKEHKMKTKEYYDTYIKKSDEGICICGKETPFLSIYKGYQNHCCSKCAQNDPNVENKFRKNNPQKDPVIKEKTKQTCLEKYGASCSLLNKEVKEKTKQTMLAKYGVENIYLLPEIQQKARQNSHTKESNLKRELVKLEHIREIANQLDAIYIQDLLSQTKSSGWYQSNIVNIIKYKGYLFVKKCDIQKVLDYDNNSYHVYSINEKKIVDAIKSIYKGEIVENSKRIISPKELDIYLPELNVAVEYNGMYFHSSLTNTPKNYHLEKSLLCREKGIRLIHIYEFEDINKQISLLQNLILGKDQYSKNDFNKNNLIPSIPNPEIIYNDGRLVVYGAGSLK